MSEVQFIQYIKKTIPDFLMSEDGIRKIVGAFEWRPIAKNEYLLRQGKVCAYYILLKGHMRAYTTNDAGVEITTNFFSGERVVFDSASFFMRQPSEESIVALTDCEGYYTTFETLNRIFHEVPEFREFGRAILVKECISAQKQKLAYFNQSAEQRYVQLMRQSPELMQAAQLRHIASFLGITDTSLSRIRRDLSKK